MADSDLLIKDSSGKIDEPAMTADADAKLIDAAVSDLPRALRA